MELPAWMQVVFMIISSVLSIVVAYLGRKITKEQDSRDKAEEQIAKEESALKTGIRAILRDRLLYVCLQCERRGAITIEELENLADIFRSYEDLGGNGAAKKIYQDTIELPLTTHPNDTDNGMDISNETLQHIKKMKLSK